MVNLFVEVFVDFDINFVVRLNFHVVAVLTDFWMTFHFSSYVSFSRECDVFITPF